MISINHETYNHWTIGDYFDWVLNQYPQEYEELINSPDRVAFAIEPRYEEGVAHWAIDNHRLKHLDEYIGRWKMAKVLFYTQPSLKSFFKELNPKSYCIPFAAEPQLHRPYDLPKVYDVGIIMQADGERAEFVNKVMVESGLKWLNTSGIEGPWRYAWELSKCKVLFNKSRRGEVNMRFFEGMSIGALVTDSVQDLKYFAEDNIHYVGYDPDSVDDAVAVLRGLVNNEEKILKISNNSRQLVIKRHSYKHRLNEIVTVLKGEKQ